MPKTPTLNIEVRASTKQLDSLIVKIDRFAKTAGAASTSFKDSSKTIKASLSSLDKATTASVKSIQKEMQLISVSMTRVADHSKRQLEKITKSGITATDKLGNATVRNLNKIEKAYNGINRATAKAKTDIIAASREIKANAEQMGKNTANFGKKLSSALSTIENKLDAVLKGIQAMSRSAANAAKSATRAVQQHEKALKNAGQTARNELQAQERLYKSYSKGIQGLFMPAKYEERSLAGLIAQRRSFNTLLKQTAVRGGMPGQYEGKGRYEKGEKMPQLPFGKIDDSGLRAWGRGESVVMTQAMSHADMLRLKYGQLSAPLDALSRKLLDTGRNMRWIGQNLFMTFTAPLGLLARRTTQLYLSVAQEYTRIQKVAGLDVNSKNLQKQAKDLKTFQRIKADIGTGVGRYGISPKSQAALFGDIVAMGYSADKTATSIRGMTTEAGQMADEIMRTATLGDIGIKTATDFYRTMLKVFVSAQPGVKTFSDTIQGTNFIVDQLNQIENKTSINLNQLADAMPVAAGAAKLFGLKAAELASTLTGLYDKGIAVNTAATGMNFSLTRILAPTKKAAIVFDQAYGAGALSKVQSIGGGMERLIELSKMYRELLETQGKVKVTQVFSELVSKRQIKTFEPLVSSINEGTDQVRTALQGIPKAVEMAAKKGINISEAPFYDLVPLMAKFKDELLKGANGAEGVTNGFIRALIASNGWATTTTDNVKELANELQKLSAREIDIKLKSDPIRYQVLVQTIKMLGAEIGQFLFPMLIKLTTVIKKLVQGLNNLTPSTKALLSGLAVALAAFGPVAIAIGSFRSVLGFVGKTIGLVLPKMTTMSLEALLLATNMGELNLANSTVVRVGKDMAAVIENNNSKLSKLFLKMRGAKAMDVAVTEAQVAAEQAHASAIGKTITAEEARQRALRKNLPKSLVFGQQRTLFDRLVGRGPSGVSPTTGKSPIARRIMGMPGPRSRGMAGFQYVDDAFDAIHQRYDPARIAQQLGIPTGTGQAETRRRGLVTSLAETLGIGPRITEQFPTAGYVMQGVNPPIKKSKLSFLEFTRRRKRVLESGQNLPLPDYIWKQQLVRNSKIAEGLEAMVTPGMPQAKGVQEKSANIIKKVLAAAREGNLEPLMAYYSKTSPGMQARLDPLVEMAQAPIDVSIDQGVERKPTMRQRISRGFRGRRSPAAKAAKALLDDAIEAPLESAAVELGGAGGGALENAVERERIKKKFRSVLKPYSKGILQTLATPYTEIGRQMFRPVRALAFGKEKIYDEKTGEFLRKERRTGIANNRLFRGVRAVAAAPKAAQARAQEVLKSVAAQGGIRGVLSSKETTDKFKQLQGAATKGLRLFTQFGIFTPIILAIAAGIFLIAKNWDKVYKAMAPGIKSIKEAWGKLMEAFKGVGQIFSDTFRTLEGDSKSGEESITSPFDAVGQILNSVLEVISTTVEAIASLINKLAPLFQWLANIMYNAFGFIIHLVKAIAKLLKGDFTEAWGYAKLAIGFFLKYILSITRPILSVFSTIAKIVLKTIGKILTAASKLPGVGKYAAKARDAINSMAEGFNLEKILGEQIDNIFMKEREITATEIAGESIYKPSKRKTENKQIQEPDIPGGDAAADAAADAADRSANKMSNIWDNFLSTLKSKLDETINELKETLNKSFEKVWEQRLKVYDDQIKAIDDLEKKEEELLATQEYIQNRREALNKRSIDQQNYVRNRALAVYEGRIDDARMLDLEFSQTNAANNKAISDLDTSRARDLLKKERDLQRQRIQDAKTAAEELKKIEEENFKKQIDLITQYTPRTDAEWRVMMDTINATIANYGMPAITGSFMDGMAVFQQASDNAKNDLMASAFWSGEWIDTAVLDWISKLSGIPLQNLIKAASDAGAAVGGAFADGVGDTEDEEKPKPGDPNFVGPTVEEAIRYQQRKNFNPQELADAFQGWGPSMPAPQTTVPPLLDRAWSLRPAPGTPPPPPGTPTLGPAIRSRGRSRPAPSYRPRSVFQRAIDTMKDQFEGSGFDSPILKGIVGLIGGGSKGTINLFKSLEDIPKKGLSILGSVFGTIKRGIAGEEVSFKNAAAKNIGKPIIEGIGVGANNETARRKVSTNVKDAVNKANRDVQRDNEIASPSRRFGREVGQPITLGIAAGILNEKVVAVLMQSFETLLRPLLNVERNGKIKINFEVETGGIRSGIEAKLNEILGGQIQFRKPRVFTEIENMFKSIIAGARAFVKQLDISTGTPVGRVGPAQSALESYLSSPIPRLAVGGIVKRRPGGIMANIGEGRYDEAVIPLPRGLKDFSTSFRASTSSMGRFEGSMQTAMSAALREYAGQMPSGDSGQVNIYVDNFIGQPQWFESMMTEYGVKVAPNKQRSYGTMNRKVTSYQDNAFRTGRI